MWRRMARGVDLAPAAPVSCGKLHGAHSQIGRRRRPRHTAAPSDSSSPLLSAEPAMERCGTRGAGGVATRMQCGQGVTHADGAALQFVHLRLAMHLPLKLRHSAHGKLAGQQRHQCPRSTPCDHLRPCTASSCAALLLTRFLLWMSTACVQVWAASITSSTLACTDGKNSSPSCAPTKRAMAPKLSLVEPCAPLECQVRRNRPRHIRRRGDPVPSMCRRQDTAAQ